MKRPPATVQTPDERNECSKEWDYSAYVVPADEGLWALAEMTGAILPDARFLESCARNIDRLTRRCGESYSAALGHDGRQSFWRLFNNDKTTVFGLLYGHYMATAKRCEQHQIVIVADDSTAYNYSSHKALTELGPISDKLNDTGVWAHCALAMTTDGVPLGLLDLYLWTRNLEEFGKAKDRHDREFKDKESFKWVRSMQAVERFLQEVQQVYMVTDRESDVFEYIAAERLPNIHLVLRAAQPRKVTIITEETDGKPAVEGQLFDVLQQATEVATVEVKVSRTPERKERQAQVSVRAMEVYLQRPVSWPKSKPGDSQKVTVIWAIETELPKNVEPQDAVSWVLLSTDELGQTPEERGTKACLLLHYYSLRWQIERLHYTLKSGCEVEKLQIEPLSALLNALAISHIVAWRLLTLTHLARHAPDTPASAMLEPDELTMLSAEEGKPIKTIKQAVTALAKLGGYEPYRSAPPPGVKCLWRGLRALHRMIRGWRLMEAQKCKSR